MGWFKKKADPISDRARALNDQIAALEAQIKDLDTKLEAAPSAPRLRSTAVPQGAAVTGHAPTPAPPAKPSEPIFEEVDQNRLKARVEPSTTPEHFNELGIRKYDLAAFLRRIRNHFRGPSTSNPKLVNYLAAGGIQGLRPMRYEKRVARNRFLFVFVGLLLLLVGVFVIFFKHH
jgi:hypothetical protein